MKHTEHLTRYTASFVDELARSGLRNVVISPGSRSTPLSMLVCEHPQLKEWVLVDERSAAYFALGIALETKKPTALICTSGTAAANYFPAIVEAHYSRVPLLVLTADRPHELRDTGAPQAIKQLNMYGDYVKWFHEMALPDGSPLMLDYVRSKAARAVAIANTGNKGPVHLNFPFREPLTPDLTLQNLWGIEERSEPFHGILEGHRMLDEPHLTALIEKMNQKKKILFVCGPQFDQQFAKDITALAAKLKAPILADPLSQLRTGLHDKSQVIETYNTILKQADVRKYLKPDLIVRFGAMPVSKSFLFYSQEHGDVPQIVVDSHEGFRDPTLINTSYIYSDPAAFCQTLKKRILDRQRESSWMHTWQQMNNVTKSILFANFEDAYLTEGHTVKTVIDELPEHSRLFVGNSMPIRDVDTFLTSSDQLFTIYANRGASGIDGVVSTSLGVAASTTEHVTLIIGDLSFYHDLTGLLSAKQYDLSITIVLINNDGGGIFSFLPQAKTGKHFEKLFGTPIGLDFYHVANLYDGNYEWVKDEASLKRALQYSYHSKGLHVIEVQTERKANYEWHQQLWKKVESSLLKLMTPWSK